MSAFRFGPLELIIVLLLCVIVPAVIGAVVFIAVRVARAASQAPRGAMKKCPYCAEEIKAEAKVCRYCGRDLPPSVS